MFGSHLSIAGGMVNALTAARALKLDTVQVFTKNQQQWKAPPLKDDDVRAWTDELRSLGWARTARGQWVVVSHASYLINLASVSDDLWAKSIDLMTEEIERCERLGIALLVHHPGAFKGADLEFGLKRIADAYRELFTRTKGYATTSCLEGTTGAGSHIGGRLEHLRDLRALIIEQTGESERIAFCLDTCHLHAAGYDLSSEAKAMGVIKQIDEALGLAHVRALHLNDSKAAAGSKLDRHEHIGQGTIGKAGFGPFVREKAWAGVPKILETPKGKAKDGTDLDETNLKVLQGLARKA